MLCFRILLSMHKITNSICVVAMELRFSCVASATHFLFYRGRKMSEAINFIGQVQCNIEPQENLFQSLFKEYERVIVESLITTFGLDFIISDRHGGDVDTIHNVRQMDSDYRIQYKNEYHQQAYDNKPIYRSEAYHNEHVSYAHAKKSFDAQQADGTLTDIYTGKTLGEQDRYNVEHIISAKEIHEDRGRILSGLSGADLANSELNLGATHESINKSKQDKSVDEYLHTLAENRERSNARIAELKQKGSLTEQEQQELRKLESLGNVDEELSRNADQRSRRDYEAKIAKAYYTSPRFAKDVAVSAGKVGLRMGVKQALGFVFAEIWFAIKYEFESDTSTDDFDLKEFFEKIGRGFQNGYENAKVKYKDLFDRFLQGGIAGGLASLTTTLCNIFFTTAKNIVKIIRMSFSSLVQASKVLFINPDCLLLGERFRATTKILATGASIVAGVMVSELIETTPIGAIPIVGDIIHTFCGALVTGILSCTLLLYLDRSKTMNQLVNLIDRVPSMEKSIRFYKEEAARLEQYAAELMQIDLSVLKKELCIYSSLIQNMETAENEDELNIILQNTITELKLSIPWGNNDFNEFMSNPNNRLVFE